MSVNREELGNIGLPYADSLRLRIATEGVPGTLVLGQRALSYAGANHEHVQKIFHTETMDFARLLAGNPDVPQLKASLKADGKIDPELDVSNAFRQLKSNIPEPLGSHFIKFGLGSATWYGFLLDNQNPDFLIADGRRQISLETQAIRKRRRARAFDALEAHYSGEETGLQKKHVATATLGSAIIVVAGASVAYYQHRSRQE